MKAITFKDRAFYCGPKKIGIQTAVKNRSMCDERAMRVLNKVLLKTYLLPDNMPDLSFLDQHQRSGVRWILSRNHSYIAHAPGAGKTAETIVSSMLCSGRILYIVPPSLTENWVREVKSFAPRVFKQPKVRVVPTTESKNKMDWSASVIICPDSMLTKKWVLEKLLSIKFNFVGVDEASRYKEPDSQRTIALFGGRSADFSSPGLVYRSRHTVLLDGSPMPNRPMELWAPVYAMAPEEIDFMHMSDFGYKYCGAKQDDRGAWDFRGESNGEELKARLQKRFMHVVTEDQLNHPERLRSVLWTSEDTRSSYKKAFEQKVLREMPSSIKEDKSKGELATVRRDLGISKIKWVANYVKERLERKNESILVFAWHREVCETLAVELNKNKPLVVIGGQKADARERGFKRFQRGECKLIIGNIAAMGRGHNLQRADRVIFAEYSWSDELNKQCEKRASRRGRDKDRPVRCEYVAVPDSMDEAVLGALLRKERVVKKVIG